MVEQTDPEQQPLLPRFGMIWFFIIVTLVAIALGIIRSAEQGQALAAAMVFTCFFVLLLCFLASGCFLVAYLFGAMGKAVAGEEQQPKSPFANSLPEQIIAPRTVDEN